MWYHTILVANLEVRNIKSVSYWNYFKINSLFHKQYHHPVLLKPNIVETVCFKVPKVQFISYLGSKSYSYLVAIIKIEKRRDNL